MNDRISTRPIYLRHTGANGKSHVAEHVVWGAAKFVDSQQKAAAQLNEKSENPAERKAKVEQITEAEYRAANNSTAAKTTTTESTT